MRDFRKLTVWLGSHALTLEVYRQTAQFPDHERYGVTSQLRRACASVPTNLAEGCGRRSERDFARFVTIAAGSASEVEYLLLLANDLGYLCSTRYSALSGEIIEVKKMLVAFEKRLTADS